MKIINRACDVPEHRLLPLQRAGTFEEIATVAIKSVWEGFEVYGYLDHNELPRFRLCSNNKHRKYTGCHGEGELVAHLID